MIGYAILSITVACGLSMFVAWLVLRKRFDLPDGRSYSASWRGQRVTLVVDADVPADPVEYARACARSAWAAFAEARRRGWDLSGVERYVVVHVLQDEAYRQRYDVEETARWRQQCKCPVRASNGMLSSVHTKMGRGEAPLVAIRASVFADHHDDLTVHELVHYLIRATGRKPDPEHTDPSLWGSVGGAFEYEAMSLLA